eukprot:3063845-Ditylum_brightwellii.AAC.1
MEAVLPSILDSSFDASLDVAFDDELDVFEASDPFFFVSLLPFFEVGAFTDPISSSFPQDVSMQTFYS